jgi:hypothetical protein
MLLEARWRFADEAPRIGQGERGVVIRVGRKWARFREKATGRTGKVRREIYDLTAPLRLIENKKGADRTADAPKFTSRGLDR